MTKAFFIFVAVAVLILLFMLARKISPKSADARGRETYLGLRNLILSGSRAQFSLSPTSRPTDPWAVVMDWDVGSGTATVTALSDGSASVYLSNGGGYLGGIGQEPIRDAAKRAVEIANEAQPQTTKAETFPLPETGQVTFYLLTDAGVYAASAAERDLRNGQGAFAKLGNAMQEIVTQYRIFQEKNSGAQR